MSHKTLYFTSPFNDWYCSPLPLLGNENNEKNVYDLYILTLRYISLSWISPIQVQVRNMPKITWNENNLLMRYPAERNNNNDGKYQRKCYEKVFYYRWMLLGNEWSLLPCLFYPKRINMYPTLCTYTNEKKISGENKRRKFETKLGRKDNQICTLMSLSLCVRNIRTPFVHLVYKTVNR